MDCVTTHKDRMPDASGKTCKPGTVRALCVWLVCVCLMPCASPTIAQMPLDPQAYDLSIVSVTM